MLSGLEHHLLRSALLALPERRRTALWLTDVEAMTPTEVGGILHLEPAVVTGLAAGAREEVRGACLQVHQRAEVRAACRFTVDHFGSYLDDRLGRSERTLMKAHIDSCPPCRMRRAEFANLAAGLAAVAPVAPLLGGECQQHWRLHAPTGRVTLTLLEPAPAVALPDPRAHRRPRRGAVPLSSLAAAAAAILLLVALPRISRPKGAGPRETVLASPAVRALLPDVPVTAHPISAESTAGSLPVDPAPAADSGAVADPGPTVVQLVAMTLEPAAPAPVAPSPSTPKPVAPLQVGSVPETVPVGLPAVVTSSPPARPQRDKAPRWRRRPPPATEVALDGPHKNNQKQKQKRIEAGADRIAHPGQSRHRDVRA